LNPQRAIRTEEISIKRKIVNIFIAVLAFIASAAIVNGADASVDENTVYVIKNLNEYEKSIESMHDVIDALRSEVANEKKYIDDHKNYDFMDEIISMYDQIGQLKFSNGFTAVRGPGIYMTVSDSISEDENLDIMERIIHDVDITVLLNELKAAGAEAIAVNSKRITSISEVVCAGPLIRVNNERVSAPFFITAIGDMDRLYDAMTEEGSYAHTLKSGYGMEIEVRKAQNASMNGYNNSNYKIEYADIVER